MSVSVEDFFATLGLKVNETSFKKGEKSLGLIKKGVAAFAALKVGQFVSGMVTDTIDLGGHLDDLRQKTGLSAEALQGYGYAAKLGGSSLDGFASGVTKLARTMGEAKAGSKTASAALEKVGLHGAALKAALAGPDGLDEALLEISGKFADMKDGPEKSKLAMDLFGKSGTELIPTLNQGQQGLAELRKEAIDLGAVLDEDAVTNLDKLGDTIDKAKMSVGGLKNQVVAALAPALQGLVDDAVAWIKVNKDVVKSGIKGAVTALVVVVKGLGIAIEVAAKAFSFLADNAEIVELALGALATAFAYLKVQAALAWVVALGPIDLIVIAVGAISVALVLLVKHWDEVTDAVADAARTVRHALGSAWQYVKNEASSLWNGLKSIVTRIGDAFVHLGQTIKQSIHDAVEFVLDQVERVPGLGSLVGAGRSLGRRAAVGGGANVASDSEYDAFTRGAAGPQAMLFPQASGAAGSTIQIGDIHTTIEVSSTGDAVAVANESKRVFDAHLARVLRHAVDSVGTGGGVG